MKRKMFTKTAAMALAGAMALSMASGCGIAASAEEAAGIDAWEPFAENVKLTVPVYDRGKEGVPTVNDNYWTKWIQENFGDKYNITVEFVPITRTDVMTDYALMAASESLPTILMEYDYPKVSKWANDGYLATFDMEEFAKVAPDYYNRMVENNQLSYSEMNGETYFALAYRPYYDCRFNYQYFVRMDWLRQVGYDHVPVTRAEEVDAMTKIQEAGIAEHPLGGKMVSGLGSDQNYEYRTYPMDEEEWAMYGDVNICSLGWEPNRLYLKKENENYNLGFTNPEYYITDSETEQAAFINGDIYQFGTYISAKIDWMTAFYEQNPDAELALKPVWQVDEENNYVPAWRADNPFGMIVGFSSFASEDEIKAAWMYMEWLTQEDVLFTMQWGIEGENFNYGEDGLPVSVSDYSGDYTQGYNNSKDYWCITVEARNAGTVEDQVRSLIPQDLPQNFTQDVIDFYYARVELAEQGYAVNDAIFGVTMEAEGEYSGTLTELYKEYRDQLTMCAPEEFDALYDELSQKYLDAGYQEILDERKTAYEAGNSTKLIR